MSITAHSAEELKIPPEAHGCRGEHFRSDIEGLRAIAILLVVLYHAGVPGLDGGYVGVDVFFVVSGYLITSLLLRELDATHAIALSAFYARRARRLLPAVIVTMLFTGIVAAYVYAPAEQSDLASTFAWTSMYASNLYFARGAIDYLGGDAGSNPLLHTWSLAVEEQFYFVWPLMLLGGVGLLRVGRTSRLLIFAALGAISFCFSWYLTSARQPSAFFLSPARAWEFALGAAGSVLAPSGRLRLRSLREDTFPHRLAVGALGWFGFATILAGSVCIGHSTAFPGWAALIPTSGTAMVLLVGASPGATLGRFLNSAPLQELGRLSYSWYLWHWPALVLAAAVGFERSVPARLAVLVGSLLLAKLSYHLVETPIRNSRWLVAANPVYSLLLALALTVTVAGSAVFWKRYAIQASQVPAQRAYSVVRADLPEIYAREDCDTFFRSPVVADCIAGSTSSAATVVLLGDSHSGQWFPAVEAIALKRNWRLVVLTKSACPVLEAPVFLERLHRKFPECEQWFEAALRRIELLRPQLVIASSFTDYRDSESTEPLTAAEWFDGTAKAFGVLSRASGRVVLLRDTPFPGFDVPLCLARRAWRPEVSASCSFGAEDSRTLDVYRIQQRAVADYSNVAAVDLSEAICPMARCEPERAGTIVFRDRSHLSGTFAAKLAPELEREIDALVMRRTEGR